MLDPLEAYGRKGIALFPSFEWLTGGTNAHFKKDNYKSILKLIHNDLLEGFKKWESCLNHSSSLRGEISTRAQIVNEWMCCKLCLWDFCPELDNSVYKECHSIFTMSRVFLNLVGIYVSQFNASHDIRRKV